MEDVLPEFMGATSHSFSGVAHSLCRIIYKDVRGPLASFLRSSRSEYGSEGRPSPTRGPKPGVVVDDVNVPVEAVGPSPRDGGAGSFEGATGESLFPCPPPFAWPREYSEDARSAVVVGVHLWLNLIVVCLSFIELRWPRQAPPGARRGDGLSPRQARMIERFLRLLEPWSGVSTSLAPDILGRITDKFTKVHQFFELLVPWATGLRRALDPYVRHVARLPSALSSAFTELKSLRMKNITASRIRFKKGLARFWPGAFLCRSSQAGYQEPGTLRPVDVPPVKACGDFCTPEERLLLFRLMDDADLFALAPSVLCPRDCRAGLGGAGKDAVRDRLILMRKPENGQGSPLPVRYSKMVPHAALMCELDLSGGRVGLVSGEDLCDFFYSFLVTISRALRNAVKGDYCLSFFTDFKAYHKFRQYFGEDFPLKGLVCGLLDTMGQGDGSSPDFAQESHLELGLSADGMRVHWLLRWREPIPRGPFTQGLMTDDHVGILVVEGSVAAEFEADKSGEVCPHDDVRSFDAMLGGYARNHLMAHKTKRFRRERERIFWGGLFDGRRRLSCAPRERTLSQILLTMCLVRLGVAPLILIQMVVGGWIFIAMFRRAFFCLLFKVFQEMADLDVGALLVLTVVSKTELILYCVLAPLMVSDLGVSPSPFGLCSDASEFCAGGTRTKSWCPRVIRELYRHRERRGWWAPLTSRLREFLRSSGLVVSDPDSGADLDPSIPPREKPWWGVRVWLVDLVRSASWQVIYSVLFRQRGHINIQETRSYRMLVRYAATWCADSRVPFILDSRVLIGGVGKGRSSAEALDEEHQRSLPSIVGGGVYVAALHVPSGDNSADAPSRRRPLVWNSEPRPAWLHFVEAGFPHRFDMEVDVDSLPEGVRGWGRIALRLLPALLGGGAPWPPVSAQPPVCVSDRDEFYIMWRALRDEPPDVDAKVRSRGQFFPAASGAALASFPAGPCVPDDGDVFHDRADTPCADLAPVSPAALSVQPRRRDRLTVSELGPASRLLRTAHRFGGMLRPLPALEIPSNLCSPEECAKWVDSYQPSMERNDVALLMKVFVSRTWGTWYRLKSGARPAANPWGRWEVPNLQRDNADALCSLLLLLDMLTRNQDVIVVAPVGLSLWKVPEADALLNHPSMWWGFTCACAHSSPDDPASCARTLVGGSFPRIRMAWKKCRRRVKAGTPVAPVLSRERGSRAGGVPFALAERALRGYSLDRSVPRAGGAVPAKDSAQGKTSRACEDGDGPPRGRPRTRGEFPLRRPLSTTEALKRRSAFIAFNSWLLIALGFGTEMVPLIPSFIGAILAVYGKQLFEKESSISVFVQTILSVQDQYRYLRGYFTPAWDAVRVWSDIEPTILTTPMPHIVLRAAIVTAWSWGWRTFARYLAHAFYAMHRGIELRNLLREDCVAPSDALLDECDRRVLYARVVRPKNAWVGPKTQHASLEVVGVVEFVSGGLRGLWPKDHVYPFSQAQTAARFNKIMTALEIPEGSLTSRSLRGGGYVLVFREDSVVSLGPVEGTVDQ